MAMSLNGMIASKNGDENFLSETNWESFAELAKQRGCFIIGRKTYEAVQKWPDYNFDDIDAKLKMVVSTNTDLKLDPPFIAVSSPQEAVEKAASMNFEEVLLTGGSTINSVFLGENLIDEVILDIEPAIIGSGVPLFAEKDFEKRLSFIDSVKIADDILQVRYKVNKS
jgi:dihydrofolate reductase